MWCSSAVNLTRLSRLAVSRMPSSPFDAASRLGVRTAGGSPAFPLAAPLPSTASAEHSSNGNKACPLFGGFFSVGSEEARLRASLRPPLKLHVRFSRMQLSRRPSSLGRK